MAPWPTPRAALERFSAPTRDVVRGGVRRADAGAGRRLGGDRRRPARAGGRADRLRQDAVGVPVGDRPAAAPSRRPRSAQRCRVLYISPLKALAVDVERNLRAPLTGIRHTAERLGAAVPDVTRRHPLRRHPARPSAARSARTPPDILITTPESLFLMLTSPGARDPARRRDRDRRRGARGRRHQARRPPRAHPRAARRAARPSRPSGSACPRRCGRSRRSPGSSAARRRSRSWRPPSAKEWDLKVVVPVEDMTAARRRTTTPTRPTRRRPRGDLDLAARRGARRRPDRAAPLDDRLRQLPPPRRAAHRPAQRDRRRAGRGRRSTPTAPPPAQVMAQSGRVVRRGPGDRQGPPRLGLQGAARAHRGRPQARPAPLRGRDQQPRARHRHGRGRPGDPDRVAAERRQRPAARRPRRPPGRRGLAAACCSPSTAATWPRPPSPSSGCAPARSRRCACPTNPLDVLAQQVVADDRDGRLVGRRPLRPRPPLARRSPSCPRSAYDATLDLLSGRYPSDEFAELRPRIVWDRVTGSSPAAPAPSGWPSPAAAPSPTAGCSASSSSAARGRAGGSASSTRRWSTSPGSATSSRSARPAGGSRTSPTTGCWSRPRPAYPGGCRSGRATRSAGPPSSARRSARSPASSARCRARRAVAARRGARPRRVGRRQPGRLPRRAASRPPACCPATAPWWSSGSATSSATGGWSSTRPTARPVHAPWALAINARLRERYGVDGQAIASDDGIVLRIPDTDAEPPGGEVIVFEPDEIERPRHRGGRRLGAVRLPVPRVRRPGAAAPPPRPRPALAAVAAAPAQRRSCSRSPSKYPSFPIVLEAVRECLQDVYDLPALVGADAAASQRREVGVVDVDTHQPSPFARSLLFGYVAQFVYEGDSPIAERRAAALSLDQGLLAELLGRAELRELLDPEVLAEVEAELQRLDPDRRARDAEGVADLLRLLGPLTADEVADRSVDGADADRVARPRSPTPAASSRSGWPARSAGPPSRTSAGCATASACRCRPARPTRSPSRSTTRSPTWSRRYARTHGPFTAADVAARLGLGAAVVRQTLQRLGAQGRVLEGEFRPAGRRRRVVRRRGAAPAAPPLAGPAAPGGRAGRAGRARPVPAGLAARQTGPAARRPARRRRRAHRRRPARRLRRPGLRAGAAGPAGPGAPTTSRRCSTS